MSSIPKRESLANTAVNGIDFIVDACIKDLQTRGVAKRHINTAGNRILHAVY